jgi:hypothetical protein
VLVQCLSTANCAISAVATATAAAVTADTAALLQVLLLVLLLSLITLLLPLLLLHILQTITITTAIQAANRRHAGSTRLDSTRGRAVATKAMESATRSTVLCYPQVCTTVLLHFAVTVLAIL